MPRLMGAADEPRFALLSTRLKPLLLARQNRRPAGGRREGLACEALGDLVSALGVLDAIDLGAMRPVGGS
jgi:hypothetical protein